MATRTRKSQPATPAASATSESKLADFAQDLGTLLGQAQNKAEHWLAERKAIVDHLVEVRDTATRLLSQLGHASPAPAGRKPANPAAPKPAKKATRSRKKRTMSPEARERIAAAQRARWAKVKKSQ